MVGEDVVGHHRAARPVFEHDVDVDVEAAAPGAAEPEGAAPPAADAELGSSRPPLQPVRPPRSDVE